MHAIIFIFLLWFSPVLFALEADKKEPLHIKADQVFFDHQTGINTYKGHVVLTQGTTQLEANTIVVNFNTNDELEKIVAKGTPAHYRTLFDSKKPEVVGVAGVMEYYPSQGILRLSEAAKITEGGNSFEGSQIEYNIWKKIVTSATAENGKIHIQLQPQKKWTGHE
jgi:lipopolysaccharide export system protein LptA